MIKFKTAIHGDQFIVIKEIGGHEFEIGEIITPVDEEFTESNGDGNRLFKSTKHDSYESWWMRDSEVKPYINVTTLSIYLLNVKY